MVDQRKDRKPEVDAVIPVYGERAKALAATLSACVAQTCTIASIFVVVDGSLNPWGFPLGRGTPLRSCFSVFLRTWGFQAQGTRPSRLQTLPFLHASTPRRLWPSAHPCFRENDAIVPAICLRRWTRFDSGLPFQKILRRAFSPSKKSLDWGVRIERRKTQRGKLQYAASMTKR
jgi:cellulose synthase/poly-beta-1,6-N-acetylglucosamine synthase-like glycosyltransferase